MSREMAHLVTDAINEDAKELNDYGFPFEIDAIDLVPIAGAGFVGSTSTCHFTGPATPSRRRM